MMMVAIPNPKVDIDLFFSQKLLLRQQVVPRLQLAPSNVYLVRRREFRVSNDLSKKIEVRETQRNPELQQGFRGVKVDLKEVRTNQRTEELNKIINALWTEFEAEGKAKKVKDDFEMGKIESTLSIGTSGKDESKSPLSKMWEAFKYKMRSYIQTVLKREADLIQDHPHSLRLFLTTCPDEKMGIYVHGEPEMSMLYNETLRRHPTKTFSFFEYFTLNEVQKVVKQVLIADFNFAAADTGKFTHHLGFLLDLFVSGKPDFIKLYTKMQRKNPTFSSSSPEFHREVEKLVKPIMHAHFKKQGVGATRVGEGSSIPKGNESNF